MQMIKLSDYVFKRLAHYNIKDVFMISGGGAMHLNDSAGKNPEIKYFCNHHEQASAIAAEGYARIKGELAVVVVTTGPGGTNCMTGLIGQWLDSVPVLYISGQVKYETTIDSCQAIGLRQLGDQEINIVDIVKPVTKFSEMVKNPNDIKLILDKAIHAALSGRPGPVWVDIPLNIQSSLIDENQLAEWNFQEEIKPDFEKYLEASINECIDRLKRSQRPVILAGNGIRISGARDFLFQFLKMTSIPVVTSFLGCDLVPTDHDSFIGHPGTIGNRPGNFAVQNSDFLLCIGTRNNIRQISYNWNAFARAAFKVVVDVDQNELNKPTLIPDLGICCDASIFLKKLIEKISKEKIPDWSDWLSWNQKRKIRYPAFLTEYSKFKDLVHPYYFIHHLSGLLGDEEIIVTGNATPSIVMFQAGMVKKNQRILWNSGCASMGYDLPAAIGAAVAAGKGKRVICLAGDGSIQMNIQELQTVFHHQLPIKIFIFDNAGYISIRQTQDAYFQGRLTACSEDSGVSMPDFYQIAKAYKIRSTIIDRHDGLIEKLSEILNNNEPEVCHVKLVLDYKFAPKLSSEKRPDGTMVSKPLEDMYPFLEREEFHENMIIPEYEGK
jgi:acetolactate synthase-1/2/3 large subunit